MRTAPTNVILRQDHAGGEVGRAIQCKGCGELGRAAWEKSRVDAFDNAARVTRLSGNFYLHHEHIACGRCQQIYRAD
jgi:hypothetical protein